MNLHRIFPIGLTLLFSGALAPAQEAPIEPSKAASQDPFAPEDPPTETVDPFAPEQPRRPPMPTPGGRSQPDDPFLKNVDPGQNDSPDALILFETFRVPAARFREFERIHPFHVDATPLRHEVQAWVEAGEASLRQSGFVRGRSGELAQLESGLELIYPIEFDPPDVPGQAAAPTSFDVRQCGFTFEVEAMVSPDAGALDVSLVVESVNYVGSEFRQLVNPGGSIEADDVMVPRFHSTRRKATVNLAAGSWVLADVRAPLNDGGDLEPDFRELTFLSGDAAPLPERAATEPSEAAHSQVRLEWITAGATDVSAWILANGIPDCTRGLWHAVEDWIDAGAAIVMHTDVMVAASGQEIRSQTSGEFIYAIEWDPPGNLPGSGELSIPATPTAFEVRNTGANSAVSPLIMGSVAYLGIAAEIVRHTRWSTHHRSFIEGEWIVDVQSPEFYVIRLSAGVRIPEGEAVLAGMMIPPDAEGRSDLAKRVLLFVRADAH
ncbi:hypothetical protein BH23VER1_BH23VER1_31690 [soil metagenome]